MKEGNLLNNIFALRVVKNHVRMKDREKGLSSNEYLERANEAAAQRYDLPKFIIEAKDAIARGKITAIEAEGIMVSRIYHTLSNISESATNLSAARAKRGTQRVVMITALSNNIYSLQQVALSYGLTEKYDEMQRISKDASKSRRELSKLQHPGPLTLLLNKVF